MPNHVTNKITLFGGQENIDKILDLIKGEDTCIDFNKIIPMPDTVYRGDLGPDERKLYGANNWYDWRVRNWGTKWNAYSTYLDKENNTIEFDTAWACPLEFLYKFAEMCDKYDVRFEGKWADEDCGCNVGTFYSDDGQFYYDYMENNSHEAYEIYVELKGESCTLHKDDDGNWVYHGCDDCPNPC